MDLRAKHESVARLNKALKIRKTIILTTINRDNYGPERQLAAARRWGDAEWTVISRWAGVRPASAETRALVLDLLAERVGQGQVVL